MKEFSRKFYNSKAWQDCRDAYIVSVYALCERCQCPGYIVHHKITLTPANINDVSITLNHAHLEYLCIDCHNKAHICGTACISDNLKFENGDIVAIHPPLKKICVL